MSAELILGIDGGGTSTTAWIATAADVENVLGRGAAGPSNPQAVGVSAAIASIEAAIDAAFSDAELSPKRFAAACFGLAGIDREADRELIENWSAERELTERLQVVNDALPVLYAANDAGGGIALISGTGSFAFGRTPTGATARAGGWGYLFGDEGSAYSIAVDGLRAAACAADGRGPATLLLELLLGEFQRVHPQELITAVYDPAMTRTGIAALSRVVFRASDLGDATATAIVERAVRGLADLVAAVATALKFTQMAFPLALTGGVLLHRADVRDQLAGEVRNRNQFADPIVPVSDPVRGALKMAQRAVFA